MEIILSAIFSVSLGLSLAASAQSVDVKNIDAGSDGTTTVEIHKGKASPTPTPDGAKPKWEVQDGSADVTGDESVTPKDARAAWKKACADWKTEFKNDNKENKIISLDCGTPSCGGEVGSKTCSSKAAFKIKTRVD